MTVSSYRRKVDAMRAEQLLLGRQIGQERERAARLAQRADDLDKARALAQEAALRTQETLRIHLTAIVTTALRAVFAKELEFNVKFETKRGRTEAVIEVGEDGVMSDPLECRGGGVIDVISFALRASFWSISRTRPVLILDEPFRFLSPNLQPMASQMLQMVSSKLKLQIIMVSHVDELRDAADRTFDVEYRNGESIILQK